MTLRANDKQTWMNTIWNALYEYRDNWITEGVEDNDAEWSDICTAMAWLEEELELSDNQEITL